MLSDHEEASLLFYLVSLLIIKLDIHINSFIQFLPCSEFPSIVHFSFHVSKECLPVGVYLLSEDYEEDCVLLHEAALEWKLWGVVNLWLSKTYTLYNVTL